MISSLNMLIIIIIFGGLVFLSFLHISNPLKVNKKANFYFGLFLLVWSTFWMEEIANLVHFTPIRHWVLYVVHCTQVWVSVLLCLSVVYFINPNFKFKTNHLLHLILPFTFFISLYYHYFLFNAIAEKISNLLILIQSIIYAVLSYILILKHQKKIVLIASNIYEINLNWIKNILVTIVFLTIVITIYSLALNSEPPNIYINFTILIVVFFIAYSSFMQSEIYPRNKTEREKLIQINFENKNKKNKRKILNDEQLKEHKEQLDKLMNFEKPFLENDINLVKLAEQLSITPHQLSYLINQGYQQNFFQYINTFRVEYAKKLLADSSYDKLTILGIAFESGFNSKTVFNTTFKKKTGQTPSEYKQLSRA